MSGLFRARSAVVGNASGLVAACLFGSAVVATRAAVADVPPLSLAFLRFGQGSLLLVGLLLLVAPHLLRVRRQDMGRLVLVGALLFTGLPIALNFGLTLTTASQGAVMLATMPLWAALISRLIGRTDVLSGRQLAGIVLSLVGVTVMAGGAGFGGSAAVLAGNGLALLAAACGGAYSVVAKPLLTGYRPITVTTYAMLGGTALLLPCAMVEGLPSAVGALDLHDGALILYLGIFGGALAYWLITTALARLTPALTTAYLNLNPVVASMLAVLLLGESLTIEFIAGFALIAAGLVVANLPVRSVAAGAAEPITRVSSPLARVSAGGLGDAPEAPEARHAA
jgi:drug/metabolite transporter (DMT)-like permease